MKAVTMNHSSRAVHSTRRRSTTSRRLELQCIPAIGSAKRWETRVRVGKESLPTAASSNRFQRTRSWNYSWRLAGMNYITILAHFLSLFSNKHGDREMYEEVEVHLHKTYPRHSRAKCVCLFQKNPLCLKTVNSY